MKSFFIITFLLSALFIFSPEADAQDRGFGIGAVIGAPDGISMKSWVSETGAIAGAASFFITENNSSLYIHADYLHHKNYDQLNWDTGYLNYYYGGGVRLNFREAGLNNFRYALRAPIGININFIEIPVDFFVEIAPTLDIDPALALGFNGGLGFRFFLN
ncbi:MAG: hypothetical protein WD604_16800 [Balneolaceae bacterium]